MLQKRFGAEHDEAENEATLAAIETSRSITSAPVASPEPKKDDEKMSLFWRVFGGTILSIVALVCITLFNNMQGSINDLRSELSREREIRATLAKKDDVDARLKTQYERIRAVESFKVEIEGIKERSSASATSADAVRKDLSASLDALKKETAGIEVLKERVSLLEGLKKDVAGVEALKEKLATVSADLKSAREEAQKTQQEVEKNKAADLERKASRDAQAKQLDETIKELQKNVQACREKIARLEGAEKPKAKLDKEQ